MLWFPVPRRAGAEVMDVLFGHRVSKPLRGQHYLEAEPLNIWRLSLQIF